MKVPLHKNRVHIATVENKSIYKEIRIKQIFLV